MKAIFVMAIFLAVAVSGCARTKLIDQCNPGETREHMVGNILVDDCKQELVCVGNDTITVYDGQAYVTTKTTCHDNRTDPVIEQTMGQRIFHSPTVQAIVGALAVLLGSGL